MPINYIYMYLSIYLGHDVPGELGQPWFIGHDVPNQRGQPLFLGQLLSLFASGPSGHPRLYLLSRELMA